MELKRFALKDRTMTPTGGWMYDDKDTGKIICGSNFEHLVVRVRGHRQINKLTIPDDLDLIIEDQLAAKCPECMRNEMSYTPIDQSFKLEQQTTPNQKVLILQRAFKETGASVVPLDEAERRAGICRYCIHNVSRACLECNGVMTWIRGTMGVPELKQDKFLHTCVVHGIYNKAQVHLPVEVFKFLMKPAAIKLYPANCWKRFLLDPPLPTKGDSDEKET